MNWRTIGTVAVCAVIHPLMCLAEAVTFARDVAPILQAKCQRCHRPGTSAPMPLLTYQDARPWARAIKQAAVRREMPPWNLDRGRGIQRFKNDPSLTAAEIATLATWSDLGAPPGDPAALPVPVVWTDADRWQLGQPDVIVSLPPRTVPAGGPDQWADYLVDTGLTEDRYIRAVETRPGRSGRRVVHHLMTFLVQPGEPGDAYLSEYAVGKDPDVFPAGSGRRIARGARLRVNVHDHPVAEAVGEHTEIGLFLYPKGTIPEHQVAAVTVGLLLLDDDLDIPANRMRSFDAYTTLTKPARVLAFQPHMHRRGTAMWLEALYPGGDHEVLGAVDRYDFNMQIAYLYEDDVSPLLPAGTVLHAVATYDNTRSQPTEPRSGSWVGFGNRSIDEMFQCHVLLTELDEGEYQTLAGARKAPR